MRAGTRIARPSIGWKSTRTYERPRDRRSNRSSVRRARPSAYNLNQFCYRPDSDTDEHWCLSCAFGDEHDDYERQDDDEDYE